MASKTDIARAVAQAEKIRISDAVSFIDTIFSTIFNLTKNEKVTLIGFGSFQQKTTKERRGRNPRTGETITIPAKTKVHFKPSSGLVTRQPVATRQAKRTAKAGNKKDV